MDHCDYPSGGHWHRHSFGSKEEVGAFETIDNYLFPSAGRWIRLACYLIDYFIIGYDILRKAAKGIKNRQAFDGGFLMAVAAIVAMALVIHGMK